MASGGFLDTSSSETNESLAVPASLPEVAPETPVVSPEVLPEAPIAPAPLEVPAEAVVPPVQEVPIAPPVEPLPPVEAPEVSLAPVMVAEEVAPIAPVEASPEDALRALMAGEDADAKAERQVEQEMERGAASSGEPSETLLEQAIDTGEIPLSDVEPEVAQAIPDVPEDPDVHAVSKILEEDMEDLLKHVSDRWVGTKEHAAWKDKEALLIHILVPFVKKRTLSEAQALKSVRQWLHAIPGLNAFFLEKAAIQKTQELMKLIVASEVLPA